jgi:hypothetical protein
MSQLSILPGPFINGDYEIVKHALEIEISKDTKIIFEYEPYCNIQTKKSLKTFQLLLDDPRFVFDDLFIARQLYFSAFKSRNLVMKHPRFLKVVNARVNFTEYFYERYGENGGRYHNGMYQRYYQAQKAIQYWRKENLKRLVFHLYPALIQYTRSFKERYYAPNGPGFLKAKEHFEEMLNAP